MKTPDTPHNEDARLDTLISLSVLDTPAEERFDRLTRMASKTFNVPIALVSLVDDKRQWFKSKVGLDACETERKISFCGHAIFHDEVFIISDAKKDLRFADNPLVVNEPKIRFYAGVPLKSISGLNLGTFCIIDTKPRELNKEEIEILTDMAKMVERELAIVHLATVDDLTKIPNRRGFKMFAKKVLTLGSRHGVAMTLVYFDLNKFKIINDEYGHDEGDKVLTEFANQIKNAIRESDVCGRLGGDEFVAFFYDTRKEEAEKIVARVVNGLDKYAKDKKLPYDIEFSHGTITFDSYVHSSINDLLKEADSLMYQRKMQTRDKYNMSSSGSY